MPETQTVRLLEAIRHQSEDYRIGAEITVSAATAQQLIAAGHAAAVVVSPAPKPSLKIKE